MSTAVRPRFVDGWRVQVDGPVSSLAVSPDGTHVAVATQEGPIAVFDARTGAQRGSDAGHDGGTTSLAWSSDGTRLVSGGRDSMITIRDARGTTTSATRCGTAWVERVAVAPDGKRFASACGRHVRLWSWEAERLHTWPARGSTVLDLAWRPSRRPTLGCVAYGAVSLLDAGDLSRAPREMQWPGSSLVLAWSPDGKYVATGDQDATVHFWIVQTRSDLMMSGYERKVRELSWSRDARWLATGGGATVTVWDCSGRGPAGTEPLALEAHEAPLRALAFRRRDDLLASAAADGSVAVWSVPALTPIATLDGDGDAAEVLAWSVDESTLYVGNADGTVTAWSEAD